MIIHCSKYSWTFLEVLPYGVSPDILYIKIFYRLCWNTKHIVKDNTQYEHNNSCDNERNFSELCKNECTNDSQEIID